MVKRPVGKCRMVSVGRANASFDANCSMYYVDSVARRMRCLRYKGGT